MASGDIITVFRHSHADAIKEHEVVLVAKGQLDTCIGQQSDSATNAIDLSTPARATSEIARTAECPLMALPDELLLQICEENCPRLTAYSDLEDFDQYLRAHTWDNHVYQLALDAFFREFILEIDVSFTCFDNGRHRWFSAAFGSCGLSRSRHARRITRAQIHVDLQHAGFRIEAVDHVLMMISKLAKGTTLKYLSLLVDTKREALSSEVARMVMERMGQDEDLARIVVGVC